MKFARLTGLFPLMAAALGAAPPPAPLYTNPRAPVEARVRDLLPRLTQPEKLSLLALDSGADPMRLDLPPIPRLGLPGLRTCDASQGLRDGPGTVFPMEVVMASTWDPGLIRQVGAAIGQEARAKDRQVIYGPCVNIHRSPQGGRDDENFSEDPYLTAQMAVAYIQGMQGEGVAACVKHFVCNDQEFRRHDVNIQVGERALREIYLLPFRAATAEANSWALMDSLNRVNGPFVAQSHPLITDLLKTEWGWDGLVISDWGSVHDTAPAANAGTDVEMPRPDVFSPANLAARIHDGQIPQAVIDDKVRRVLRLMARTGLLDPPKPPSPAPPSGPAHAALALRVAQEGVTLLKNERGLLPLNRRTVRSIAVVGPNAADTQVQGHWSADLRPPHPVSVLDGIQALAGPGVNVSTAPGCPRFGAGGADALRDAVALAAKADVAVVVVGTDLSYEGEEEDPPNLSLPGDQEKLILAVAAANKNTVVVLNNDTPLSLSPWLGRVPALLDAWLAGQEGGTAIAGVLFGDVNPSGRLTDTLAARREDYSDFGSYPGVNDTMTYSEGIYVGYRHFDKARITPLFPFGYGLSYTTFGYAGLRVSPAFPRGQAIPVRLVVQNTGRRAGAEVVEVYVRPISPQVDRPVRELKGFRRVALRPGQRAAVALTLDPNAFAYWDVGRHGWRTDPGLYQIEVGASSRDIRLRASVRIQ